MTELSMLKLEPEFDDKTFRHFMGLISAEKAERINRIVSPRGKKQRLYAEIFARCMIGKHLGLQNTEISFGIPMHGKPFLIGYPDFHFNYSHTDGAVLLGISDAPIGVDIERLRPVHERIVERFLGEGEQEYIRSGTDAPRRFFKVWTAKEAFLKRDGAGFSIPLNSFDITSKNIPGRFCWFEQDSYILCCFGAEEVKNAPAIFEEKELVQYYRELL